jgi:hypothetical protein
VPTERLSMRKTREILRLKWQQRRSHGGKSPSGVSCEERSEALIARSTMSFSSVR